MAFLKNKHTVALGKIREDLESLDCSITSCSMSQYKAVSPPGLVFCSQDLGSFPPSSEASSHKHWQKQDPGPRRQLVLPLRAVLSLLLANTSNPPRAVQCEVRLLTGGAAKTTALNVIWWDPFQSPLPLSQGENAAQCWRTAFLPAAMVSPRRASLRLSVLLKGLVAKASIKLQGLFLN